MIYFLAFLASNRLARTFARASVGSRALAASWQAFAMARAAVAAKVNQTLDAHRDFTTKIALNGELANLLAQFVELSIGEILDFLVLRDASFVTHFTCARVADAKYCGHRNPCMFVIGDVDPGDTCHSWSPSLSLALLVTRIGADHADHALTANDFAITANLLYRSVDFHVSFPVLVIWRGM
jgi:hypothetical protein